MINLTIWNEFVHEQEDDHVGKLYPKGIHGCIKEFLEVDKNLNIKTATLEEPEHGLSQEVLNDTDVLIWWGHKAHDLVEGKIVDRIQGRILEGMGLLVLHSGHHSKIFKRMMGTTANIRWAERGEKERVWVCNPGHPIAHGLGEYFEIDMTEMYGEPFQVPAPDETVFVSWFEGGEVFRSGLCYKRGNGKIFYFRPGHESYPVYYNKDVQTVIRNSVHWACPEKTAGVWQDRIALGIDNMMRSEPIEPIEIKGHQVDHNYKK
jgi:trehalose utilization protein